jgi:hypothetical protein
MNQVCTAFDGAMIIASPSASDVCFRRPVLRVAESSAGSRRLASTSPVR